MQKKFTLQITTQITNFFRQLMDAIPNFEIGYIWISNPKID